MNKLVCSRFDKKIPKALDINKRLVTLSVQEKKECKDYYCIATNGHEIFAGEKKYTLGQFFNKELNDSKTLLVLTDKEAFHLTRWCQSFGLRVVSFESAFPIFNNVKFHPDIKVNYRVLKSRLAYVRKIGLTYGSLTSTLSRRIEKILRRKNKKKSSYDEIFAHAYIPPYQEVFKFFDFREERAIIALDFNSMFADCMAGNFLDPESIYFENVDSTLLNSNESTRTGLYHVILKRPKSKFFQDYHPFKYTQLGLSLNFKAEELSEIETQLFHFELDYYKKFFDEVYILSALRAENVSGHPLYSESKRLYRLRTRAQKANNPSLEKSYKLQLAMLHSATNRRAEKKIKYESFNNLLSTLNKDLHLTLDTHIPYLINSSPLLKKIKTVINDEENAALIWDLNNKSSIYSFSSQIVSKSRLKIFQTLEAFNKFEGLDICYVNTDSVHVSIPFNRRQEFFETYNDLIGTDIGKLKVQCVADKAAWFDVGHYFLFKDGEVTQWSNIGLNHKGNCNPFLDYRERYNGVRIDDGIVLTKRKSSFMSSLSYKKRLQQYEIGDSKFVDYQRFSVQGIKGFDNAMLSILKEKQASYSIKKELYNLLRLKTKL